MKLLARLIVQRAVAWTIVSVVFGLTAISAMYASRVVQDDDVLAFLPKTNPDVAAFYEIADRYGSLDVALVGVESDDVFDASFLERLQKATKRLNETDGIQYALSITSVEDFTPDPQRGGISVDYLVRELPSTQSDQEKLGERVLSRDHVVGNLVSSDGRAVMLYCFAVPGSQPRETAAKVRGVVDELFPDEKKYWGGAPFIATYVYDATQKDLRRLAPWACAAIALLVLLSFKDLVGTGLSLLSTIIGIVIPLGVMGAFDVHTNIVLGSMPVILFSLGSAYGIHIMSRFYALATTMPREDALRGAIEEVGPAVLGSGLTTVFGLLSFVMMDIAPLRTFGLFTAFGLLVALVVAVVFVPAVVVLSSIRGRSQAPLPRLAAATARLSVAALRKRTHYGALVAAITLAATVYVSRVDSRLDTTAFFDPGSPPAEADAFMQRHFGGSSFLQVEIAADMTEPAVLREVQRLADRISAVEGVSSVNHVSSVVALMNEAMEDVRRIPDTPEKVRLLYGFLTGKQAVSTTVTDDRTRALIHVKLVPSRAKDVEKILREVEALVREIVPTGYAVVTAESEEARARRAEVVADRVRGLARSFGARIERPDGLREALLGPPKPPSSAAVEPDLAAFVRSEAFGVPLGDDASQDTPERIAKEVAALGPPPDGDEGRKAWKAQVPQAVAKALGKDVADPTVDDAALALEQNAPDVWVQASSVSRRRDLEEAAGIAAPEGPKGERFQRALGHALLDLSAPTVLSPSQGGQRLEVKVTGLPVLYRGLANSVFNNQWNSLWFALVVVIGFKAILFRSFGAGLLSSVPTLITLVVVYGAMGALGVHLDIGTSMLASLIIGAGDDYAVQYLWSWFAPDKRPMEEAARAASLDTAAGIWINALMMAVGFFVLTLGEARPLKNVGGLTAAAMLVAGLATFVVCPILARKRSYAPPPPPTPEPAVDPEPEESEKPVA
jgi:predicted RND superfamily exporter protein